MNLILQKIDTFHFEDWKEIVSNQQLEKLDFQKIISKMAKDEDQKTGFHFVLQDSNIVVGVISVFNILGGQFKSGMLDYTIKPTFRRKGYAFEGLKLIENFSFEEIGLKKLVGYVETNNIPSQKLLSKSKYEHTHDKYGFFSNFGYREAIVFTKIKPGLEREH